MCLREPAGNNCRCKKPDDRLERNAVRHVAVVTSLLVAWFVPPSANAQRVVAETFMIPAVDPGIQLHVRNKRLDPHSPDSVVNFGAAFRDSDIAIGSLSWIERGSDGEPDG